jgi:hypothetical protein
VAWLLPELEVGVELELMPLELELPELDVPELEFPELEFPELEVPELEVPELEVPELEVPELEVPELVEDGFPDVDEVPVDDVAVVLVEPGRARARAPAATTLATLTAVVAERILRRPFCLSAMARRMPSGCGLMSLILWSGLPESLHGPSG